MGYPRVEANAVSLDWVRDASEPPRTPGRPKCYQENLEYLA
jgi:hypothetical protein